MNDKKKKQIVRKNFLESLKEIGGNVAKTTAKDVIAGVAKAAPRQILGGLPSQSPFGEFGQDQMPTPENKERFQWSRQEFTDIRIQERMIFKKAEQEVKLEIEAIRDELLKLVKSSQRLAKQVEIAAIQAPVAPGVYHVTFLEKLRGFIIFLRKNITESRNWLATCNAKAKKRNYYWNQFKKSGTKFMLSSERYMATQAG
jgi:hypothetical protein